MQNLGPHVLWDQGLLKLKQMEFSTKKKEYFAYRSFMFKNIVFASILVVIDIC